MTVSDALSWRLPEEPGREVKAVRAERHDGTLGPYWHRDEVPGDVRWIRYRSDDSPAKGGEWRDVKSWHQLFGLRSPDGYQIVRLVAAILDEGEAI